MDQKEKGGRNRLLLTPELRCRLYNERCFLYVRLVIFFCVRLVNLFGACDRQMLPKQHSRKQTLFFQR